MKRQNKRPVGRGGGKFVGDPLLLRESIDPPSGTLVYRPTMVANGVTNVQ